jgi:hypothetical protein
MTTKSYHNLKKKIRKEMTKRKLSQLNFFFTIFAFSKKKVLKEGTPT